MPPKKANKGAFPKGHAGHGQRNAAVDAADEPDAGTRANECPPVALAHAHPHECTGTHTLTHTDTDTRTQTRTHARTHTATHCKTHAHTNLRAHTLTRAHSNTQNAARSLARMGAHAPAHPARRNTRVQTSCYSSASSSRHKAQSCSNCDSRTRPSSPPRTRQRAGAATPPRGASGERSQARPTKRTTGWPRCSKSGRKSGKMGTSDSGSLSLR